MPNSESFNWLHLTDLHFGQAGQRPLWPNVREAFFTDLRRLHERCGPWQAVLFTGDFVQAGHAEEFKGMELEVLGRLWKELRALGSGDAALLAVPGNHDLVWPEKPTANVRQLLRKDGFSEIAEEFWTEPDGEYRQVLSAAFANYRSWWTTTQFRPSATVPLQEGLLPGDFAVTLSVGTRQVGIIGLNTTFLQLAGGDYTGRLAWDLRQLEAVCGRDMADWFREHDVCLLLTHQGPEWLDSRSKEAYKEINPAGRFAVHLFGHMHETVVRSTSAGGGKPLRQWQDCSLFGLEKYGDPPQLERRHGYGAGRIEFLASGTTLRFWPRLATQDANGWRFFPHNESCVLDEDGGTAPEAISSPQPKRTSRRRAGSARPAAPAGVIEDALVKGYTRAARRLWDIINLAGLPEDDRHLALQQFMLRQLYLPLRMVVESSLKEDALSTLEEQRERQRLVAAGRGPSERPHASTSDRISLGDWLKSVLEAKGSGHGKRKRARKIVRTPRLVILGDPGGGKTTLLRWLATAYLLRREGDPDLERLPDMTSLPEVDWLPILVRCRDLDKARAAQGDLEDLLHQALAKMELPGKDREALVPLLRARMEEGRALLLVDGLDEITDPGLRASFCERLEAIGRCFSQAPMLATSRIVGYREMHRRIGQGFAHGTLAELAPEEKDDFVRRWCEVTIPDPGRREAEEEKLRGGIHGSDRIERLTTNPMLLTTMALVQRKVGKLPTRRHKLYWEAVGVLLNWRPEVEEVMDPDETLPQLEYLAYVMCDLGVQRLRRDEVLALFEDVRRDYPNIRLLQRQTPEAFLAQLERRTGLLVEAGEVQYQGRPTAVYEFRHLTFQEYLAALAILEGRFPGHQPGTTLADRVKPLAGRVAEVPTRLELELQVTENWREALRLCIASCNDDDVDPALAAILEPRVPEESRPRAILAVLCLADEPNVSEARARGILGRFAEQVRNDDGVSEEVRTGADIAAREAALSVWNELLWQVLTAEFIKREPKTRFTPGFMAGIVACAAIPPNATTTPEWMAKHVQMLGSPSDVEAAGSSLAIGHLAYSRRAVVVPDLIENLLTLLGRGPAVAYAATWALGWLSMDLDEPYWLPTPQERRTLLQYMAYPNPDSEALRWMLTIAKAAQIHEAVPACITALGSSDDGVRAAAARALGRIGGSSIIDTLRYSLLDPAQEVRRAVLGALVRLENEDEVNHKLLTEDLPLVKNGLDFFALDPQVPISIDHVRRAAIPLRIPEEEVRARYEKMADRYNLNLEWRSGP